MASWQLALNTFCTRNRRSRPFMKGFPSRRVICCLFVLHGWFALSKREDRRRFLSEIRFGFFFLFGKGRSRFTCRSRLRNEKSDRRARVRVQNVLATLTTVNAVAEKNRIPVVPLKLSNQVDDGP